MKHKSYKEYIDKINSLVDRIEDASCMNIQPLVSIACSTYNHEKYIKDTLEGFLMQKTTFPYEIIIGDDCSTDNNQKILLEYQKRYPDKIRLRFARTNLRTIGLKNSQGCFSAVRGKYIAACEGDDYWTDPLKLQKQVDFLEQSEQIGACFTNALIKNHLEKTERLYNDSYNLPEGRVSNKAIFTYGGGIYPTCTLLFRRELINNFLPNKNLAGDERLIFHIANQTKVYFLDFVSATYNRWAGGVFSSIINDKEKIIAYRRREIAGYKKLIPLLNEENQKLLKTKLKKDIIYVIENSFSIKNIKYLPMVGLRFFLGTLKNKIIDGVKR